MTIKPVNGKQGLHTVTAFGVGVFIFSILLWLLLVAGQFAFLYAYDILHGILFIIQCGTAVLILFCFVNALNRLSKSEYKPVSKIMLIFLLIPILLFNIWIWFFLKEDGLQTGGFFSIHKKYQKENSYYIDIVNGDEPVSILIDKQTFDQLVVAEDTTYHIEYRTCLHLSSIGVLENPIDSKSQYRSNTLSN